MRRPLLAQLNLVQLGSYIIEIISFVRVSSSQLFIFGCRMQIPNQRRKASGITRNSYRGNRKGNWYVIAIVINFYFLNYYAFPPQTISSITSNFGGLALWLNFHQPSDSSTTLEILQSLFTVQFWCQKAGHDIIFSKTAEILLDPRQNCLFGVSAIPHG